MEQPVAAAASRGGGTADPLLHAWPVDEPSDWLAWVNDPQTDAELDAVRRSARRGCPYGEEAWQKQVAERLGPDHTLRPLGRPRKPSTKTDEENGAGS